MKKFLSAAALVLSVLLVASTAQAESFEYFAKYSTGGVLGVGINYPTGDPDVGDIGGGRFTGTEGTPVSIEIADAAAETGLPVYFFAGQDTNGDTFVGDPGEPSISGCARSGIPVSLAGSAEPFIEGLDITVFVSSVGSTTCRSVATAGTMILTTTTG